MNNSTNLYEVFACTADRQPDHLACHDIGRGDRCTYGMLRQRIDATAAKLRTLGISPGQCIGLHVGSGLTYIILAYAIWRCGAIVVPIATEIAAAEKVQICETIGLEGILTAASAARVFTSFAARSADAIVPDFVYLAIRAEPDRPPEFASVDAAFIRFTSGTTSAARGVVLSHSTVFERIHAANKALEIDEEDRVVWLLSMSYHFTVSIVAYLTFGAAVLICSNHFGSTIVEEAAAERGTLIYGAPQHYALMASDQSGTMLDSLRLAVSTATALKLEIADAFHTRFGVPLSQAYGIIEVGLPCINIAGETSKPGSVGKVLPDYELNLRDIGADPLKAIDIRGSGLFDAYYSPWRQRADVSRDGWFETGDVGYLDKDGYLYVTGRAKEVINVGGMKFFPQEVEVVLETHPAVLEAYVFPETHARLGEVPHALVKLKDVAFDESGLEKELRKFCQSNLSAFKVPLTLRFVGELPRTGSGKLKRYSTSVV